MSDDPRTTAEGRGFSTADLGGDWPAKAADLVESVVDGVHDKVVRPLMLVARGLVFGILIGAMVLVLSALVAVAVVRVLDVYAFGHRVWASEALVGGIFTVVGLLAWSLRRSRRSAES